MNHEKKERGVSVGAWCLTIRRICSYYNSDKSIYVQKVQNGKQIKASVTILYPFMCCGIPKLCKKNRTKNKAIDFFSSCNSLLPGGIKSQCPNKRNKARSSREGICFCPDSAALLPTSRQMTISSRLIQQPAGRSSGQAMHLSSRWACPNLSISSCLT